MLGSCDAAGQLAGSGDGLPRALVVFQLRFERLQFGRVEFAGDVSKRQPIQVFMFTHRSTSRGVQAALVGDLGLLI